MTEYDRACYIEYIKELSDDELEIEEEDCVLNMSGDKDDAIRSLICKGERARRNNGKS